MKHSIDTSAQGMPIPHPLLTAGGGSEHEGNAAAPPEAADRGCQV